MEATLLVLGLLKLQDMHGYQLGDLIDKRLKYLTDLKKPTLYHLLGRLERAGLVSKTVSREGNRPERFTFRLTRAGATRFRELLQANLQGAHAAYFADDIGLLFLSELPAGEARAYLNEKRARVEQNIADMKRAVARHQPGTPAYYTLRHHLVHLQTERAWLDEIANDLKKRSVRQDILACLAAADEKVRTTSARGKSKIKNLSRSQVRDH
jgi:DNA-binding PadR family transcriptional regulator